MVECTSCGCHFEETELTCKKFYMDDSPWGAGPSIERVYFCPECGENELEDGDFCHICGEFIFVGSHRGCEDEN